MPFEALERRTLLSGALVHDFGGQPDEVTLQTDGKALVSGLTRNGNRLYRFNSDATVDASLGNGGFVNLPIRPRALEVQPDGKILAVGGDASIAILRFHPNGTPDTSFSGDGRLDLASGSTTRGHAVAVAPDLKIVVAGTSNGDFYVARLNPNGTLDTTFSGDGLTFTDFGGSTEAALGVGVLANGKILAGGIGPGAREFAAARYNANGTLDGSFGGGDGKATGAFAVLPDSISATPDDFGVFADGRSVLIGSDTNGGSGDTGIVLTLDAQGNPSDSGTGELFRQWPNEDLDIEGYTRALAVTIHEEGVELPDGSHNHDFASFDQEDFGRLVDDYVHAVALRDGFAAAVGLSGTLWGIQQTMRTQTQGAYDGSPAAIGETMQAEDFDHGGEGVAYHDADAANRGLLYRTSCVDVGGGGTGRVVGFTQAGEWLEYTVQIPSGGMFRLETRVGNPAGGASFHYEVDGVNLTGSIAVPNTGSFNAFATVSKDGVRLEPGTYAIRLAFDTAASNSAVGNFDWLRLVRLSTFEAEPPTVPGNLRLSDRTTTSLEVTWNASTDNVGVAGYDVRFNNVLVERVGPSQRSYSFTDLDPSTQYQVSVTAFDAAGNRSEPAEKFVQTLRNPQEQQPYLRSSPWGLGERIRAYEFDFGGEGISYHDADRINTGDAWRQDDAVDIARSPGGDETFSISDTRNGEWVEYTIDVPATGPYDILTRVANPDPGGSFYYQIDDRAVTSFLNVPDTGSFDSYQTVVANSVELPAGTHQLRLTFNSVASNGSAGDFNWIQIVEDADQPPTAPNSLRLLELRSDSVLMDWNPSTDDSGVVGYEVFRNGALHATVASGRNYRDGVNVRPNTTYTYAVRAFDADGNRSDFISLTVTTPSGGSQSFFRGTPFLPGKTIEFEDFDNGGQGVAFNDTDAANNGGAYRDTGVDIKATTDSGGGHFVGWVRPGEWLEWTIDVPQSGTYSIETRLATPKSNVGYHYEIDGAVLTGSMSAPVTGSFTSFVTQNSPQFQLFAGRHVIRFSAENSPVVGGLANFNWFRLMPLQTQSDLQSADIGNPTPAGRAENPAGDTWDILGGGRDIHGNSDQFHFLYESINGDFERIVQVDSLSATDPWAKAGLMARESLAGNSRNVAIVQSAGNGPRFQRRTATGGSTTTSGTGVKMFPILLRLVRQGDTLIGYQDQNGTWVEIGRTTLELPDTLFVGAAVTSHNPDLLTRARIQYFGADGP